MKKGLKKSLKILLRTIMFVVGFFLLYAIAGYCLPFIGVNKDAPTAGTDGYDIYILSNGVHTDIVLPVKNESKDWTKLLSYNNTISKDSVMNYVGFGWGDKGFYLNTPTWADLKASTAFNAMFALSTSAMHVTFHNAIDTGALCKKIWISKNHYMDLVDYIEGSFQKNDDGAFQYIIGHAYGARDGFYEAKGTYNLFYTCNTWANNGLKSGHLKACLWTPLDKGIFYQYK